MAISLTHIAVLAALASLCVQTTCAAPLSLGAQRIARQSEDSGTSEMDEPAAIKDLLSGLGVLEIVAVSESFFLHPLLMRISMLIHSQQQHAPMLHSATPVLRHC